MTGRPQEPLADRFWSHVDTAGECWEWTGARNTQRGGYGTFTESRKSGHRIWRAHRLAYELTYGPIPPGLVILHQCDNPACVRPDHLMAGTQADNIADMMAKGRHASTMQTHCAHGHELTPGNIYKGSTPRTRRCRECHRISGAKSFQRRQAMRVAP